MVRVCPPDREVLLGIIKRAGERNLQDERRWVPNFLAVDAMQQDRNAYPGASIGPALPSIALHDCWTFHAFLRLLARGTTRAVAGIQHDNIRACSWSAYPGASIGTAVPSIALHVCWRWTWAYGLFNPLLSPVFTQSLRMVVLLRPALLPCINDEYCAAYLFNPLQFFDPSCCCSSHDDIQHGAQRFRIFILSFLIAS